MNKKKYKGELLSIVVLTFLLRTVANKWKVERIVEGTPPHMPIHSGQCSHLCLPTPHQLCPPRHPEADLTHPVVLAIHFI